MADPTPGGTILAPDFPQLEAGEMLESKAHSAGAASNAAAAALYRSHAHPAVGRERHRASQPPTRRPSASIQTRDYVTQEQRRLKAYQNRLRGLRICFPSSLPTKWTTPLRQRWKTSWTRYPVASWSGVLCLANSISPLRRALDHARENMPRRDVAEKVGRGCPRCEGRRLAGQAFALWTVISAALAIPIAGIPSPIWKRTGHSCPTCGETQQGEIVRKRSRKGRAFYGCSRYPDCDYTAWRLPRDAKPVDAANKA